MKPLFLQSCQFSVGSAQSSPNKPRGVCAFVFDFEYAGAHTHTHTHLLPTNSKPLIKHHMIIRDASHSYHKASDTRKEPGSSQGRQPKQHQDSS